jgi:hypothetical protein
VSIDEIFLAHVVVDEEDVEFLYGQLSINEGGASDSQVQSSHKIASGNRSNQGQRGPSHPPSSHSHLQSPVHHPFTALPRALLPFAAHIATACMAVFLSAMILLTVSDLIRLCKYYEKFK